MSAVIRVYFLWDAVWKETRVLNYLLVIRLFATTITGLREQHPPSLDETCQIHAAGRFESPQLATTATHPLPFRQKKEKMSENQQQLYPKWHMMPAVTCLAFTRLLVCEDCKHSSDKCWGVDIGSIWLAGFREGDGTLSSISWKKCGCVSVCVHHISQCRCSAHWTHPEALDFGRYKVE